MHCGGRNASSPHRVPSDTDMSAHMQTDHYHQSLHEEEKLVQLSLGSAVMIKSDSLVTDKQYRV